MKMKPADDIEQLVKNTRVETNAATDEQILTAAQAALESAAPAQPNIWRIIMKSRITKFAAAAAIIIVVCIGINILTGHNEHKGQQVLKIDPTTETKVVREITEETKPEFSIKIPSELPDEKVSIGLTNIKEMFVRGDVEGLIAMLDKGQWETKIAAANYLARIGDMSAVGALEKLSEEWTGDSQENPFTTAIEEIRDREVKVSNIENITDNVVAGFITDAKTSQLSNIYIVTKVIWSNGGVKEHKEWLKDGIMLRQERSDEIIIDNGVNRLVLDKENKTAQLSDSLSPFENYMQDGQFEIVSAFLGYDTDAFKIAKLSERSENGGPVYEVAYRDFYKAKVWVNAQSNLPIRLFTDDINDDRERHVVEIELVFNYDPIPAEKFKIAIPPDYANLGRIKSPEISGWVIDDIGKPVIGADVYISEKEMWTKTDQEGKFVFVQRHDRLIMDLPFFIRAFKSDDPCLAAWIIIYTPDDDVGEGLQMSLSETDKLNEHLPGKPGDLIFRNETDSYPYSIENVLLEMAPADIITGRVTNTTGVPIAEVTVWIDRMQMLLGKNLIDISNLGCLNKDKDIALSPELDRKIFTLTDENGYYEFTNLPNEWSKVWLNAKADGYPTETMEFYPQEYYDFELIEDTVTIRGIVIDNWGEPLVGREIGIDIDYEDGENERDFNIKDAVIDANGIFELTNIPAVPGLELEIRTDEKPYDWDENELTKDRDFVYYLMIEEPIHFEPDQKEYWINITPHRPDITIEVEVKNSRGDLLENIPVGVCSPGFSERLWYLTKLIAKTNEYGLCIITEAPRLNPLNLWICQPKRNIGDSKIDIYEGDLSQEYATAIAESQEYYSPMKVPVELEPGKKEYFIGVTLLTIEEYNQKQQ
jgi:hypothetical protein